MIQSQHHNRHSVTRKCPPIIAIISLMTVPNSSTSIYIAMRQPRAQWRSGARCRGSLNVLRATRFAVHCALGHLTFRAHFFRAFCLNLNYARFCVYIELPTIDRTAIDRSMRTMRFIVARGSEPQRRSRATTGSHTHTNTQHHHSG